MTTKVVVSTHDWPVKVITTDQGGESFDETVDPHSERTFHLTNTRSIAFEELPKPEVEEEPAKPFLDTAGSARQLGEEDFAPYKN